MPIGVGPYPWSVLPDSHWEALYRANAELIDRVFHYEPVWHRRDLAQRHQDILAAIGWVSPVLAATTAPLDRFPLVYAQGSSAYRAGLEALCRRYGYAP